MWCVGFSRRRVGCASSIARGTTHVLPFASVAYTGDEHAAHRNRSTRAELWKPVTSGPRSLSNSLASASPLGEARCTDTFAPSKSACAEKGAPESLRSSRSGRWKRPRARLVPPRARRRKSTSPAELMRQPVRRVPPWRERRVDGHAGAPRARHAVRRASDDPAARCARAPTASIDAPARRVLCRSLCRPMSEQGGRVSSLVLFLSIQLQRGAASNPAECPPHQPSPPRASSQRALRPRATPPERHARRRVPGSGRSSPAACRCHSVAPRGAPPWCVPPPRTSPRTPASWTSRACTARAWCPLASPPPPRLCASRWACRACITWRSSCGHGSRGLLPPGWASPSTPTGQTTRLPYDGAWLMMGPEMIHLMELPTRRPCRPGLPAEPRREGRALLRRRQKLETAHGCARKGNRPVHRVARRPSTPDLLPRPGL